MQEFWLQDKYFQPLPSLMSQGGIRGFEEPGQQVAEQDGDSELDQTIQILKEISNNDRKLVELVNDLIVSCFST